MKEAELQAIREYAAKQAAAAAYRTQEQKERSARLFRLRLNNAVFTPEDADQREDGSPGRSAEVADAEEAFGDRAPHRDAPQ
ncbi:hypothetical protein acdb102_30970 [Acidothermaceae bacterium B102]|nr:hypothetical protein acdb102_30970 [Acidothermaceae bacterium B102]